jgi:hypothetical protein
MYEGDEKSSGQQAVLSSLGLYKDRHLSLTVTSINGISVNQTRTSEFLLLPGSYSVRVQALQDFRPSLFASTWNAAIMDVQLKAEAGHTYIPQAEIGDKWIRIFFEDLGENFPRECIPLRKVVPGRSDIPVTHECR